MIFGARHGDLVPVVAPASDGPTVVWCTPAEYALLIGAEPEMSVAAASSTPLASDGCDCDGRCECDDEELALPVPAVGLRRLQQSLQ